MRCPGHPCTPSVPSAPGGEVTACRGPPLPWGCARAGRDAGNPCSGRGRLAGGCSDVRRTGYAPGGGEERRAVVRSGPGGRGHGLPRPAVAVGLRQGRSRRRQPLLGARALSRGLKRRAAH